MLLSHVQLFLTPWTAAHQASCPSLSPGSVLKLMSIDPGMLTKHLILFCPSPVLSPSQYQVFFQWVDSLHHVAKILKLFSISPSGDHSGSISFRIDWLDLLPVQRTLKSLLQHHSLKASVLWCSAFFTVQLSHLYMTTVMIIALAI